MHLTINQKAAPAKRWGPALHAFSFKSMADSVDNKITKKPKDNPAASGYKWYVIHTYSGHEQKVKNNLQKRLSSFNMEDKIKEILIPTQEKIEFHGGEKKQVAERVYPGYVLVLMKLNDETWTVVRKTPGVTGFVGRGSKPSPLSPGEIQNIKKMAKQKAPVYKTKFSVGEAIKIIDGAFTDFVGTVDQINEEQGKMTVLISIFGRETPVEIEFNQASKI